jgi:hypothetical protein
MMIDAQSSAGQQLLDAPASGGEYRQRQFLTSRDGISGNIWKTLSGFDVCFSSDCGVPPGRRPALVFGCEAGNCTAKGAVLFDADRRVLGAATTSFKAEVSSAATPAVMVFPADSKADSDYLLRVAATWHVLEQRFVRSDGLGVRVPRSLPDKSGNYQTSVSVRECRRIDT